VLKDPKKISKMLKKLQKVLAFALAVAPALTRACSPGEAHEAAARDCWI
jgi:hypothetical protein